MASGDRQTFIEEWPLFTRCECKDFFPPDNISRKCSVCEKETTWGVTNRMELYPTLEPGGWSIRYRCRLCEKSGVTVFVRRVYGRDNDLIAAQKIGQFPPPSIDIPSDVEKRLGDMLPHRFCIERR